MTIFVVRIRLSRRDGFFAKHVVIKVFCPCWQVSPKPQKNQGDALGYKMLTKILSSTDVAFPTLQWGR